MASVNCLPVNKWNTVKTGVRPEFDRIITTKHLHFWKGPLVLNATRSADLPGNDDIDPVKAEAGAIAGAVFGVLVSMGFIAFAGIMYLKRKRERDLEYHRKTKVLKQSSQSAGVYMDTTQEFIQNRTRNPNKQGPEYTSLQRDSNLYESDSEDEL